MLIPRNEEYILQDKGRARLKSLTLGDATVQNWRERLRDWQLFSSAHDTLVWYTCVLALESVNEGNFGVGAVIVREGAFVAEGRNQAFHPTVRGTYHAEARALEAYESKENGYGSLSHSVLFSSLECCPMCTVLLINSGIRSVYYAAPDPSCGMVSRWDQLPPGYRALAAKRAPPQQFRSADCSSSLVECAAAIFALNEDSLSQAMAIR
jgi:cytosine deaminase